MSQQIQIRTVKVELLRTGPSHNQLLSPLTTYLGICDGAEAGIVHVPFEHQAFLRRLQQMSVEEESRERGPVLRDLGVEIARMLGAIPRLSGSLSTDAAGPDTLIHLRLVLSASELALLPFELSKIPIGATDWAEGWLSLQVRVPVVITRRTRDTPDSKLRWLDHGEAAMPRVLFVAADPRELGGAYERHRDALIAAMAPYLKRPDQPPVCSGADHRREDFEGQLTILRNASFDDVVRECAENRPYTHIHLLAHGLPDDNVDERSYGLLLHPSPGENEVISGDRFASAFAKLVDGRIHRPTVVTLATCDSGNPGSVLIPGASMAHVLHQAGIPLVVASQFPLSMAGSDLLVNQLMPGLLRGDHPLPLLHRIRSDLHSRSSITSNDWASLVVYEALPVDLPAQLETLRYMQAMRATHIAFNQLDQAMLNAEDRLPAPLQEKLSQRVNDQVAALPLQGPYRLECLGLRAGSHKRLAWLSFCSAVAFDDEADETPAGKQAGKKAGKQVDEQADELRERAYKALVACYTSLENARRDYLEAALGFLRNEGGAPRSAASLHWVLGQHLALSAVLGVRVQDGAWEAAKLCAETYLAGGDLDARLWALGTLVELSLLKLVDADQIALHKSDPEQARRRRLASEREAKAYATDLIKQARSRSDEQVVATRKQLQRYHCWWSLRYFERAADGWPGDRSSKLCWDRLDADEAAGAAGREGAPTATSLGVARLAEELERILANRGRGKRRGMLDLDEDDADAADALFHVGAEAGDAAAAPVVGENAGAAASMPAAAAATAVAPVFLGKARPAKTGAARDAFLSIEMLPAGHGDCLWLEYGQGGQRHRVLVDGGSDTTYTSALRPRIERAKADLRSPGALEFELMILTHIDDDHIGGAIELLEHAKAQGLGFGDIWFNGWKHIAEFLGALQGEQFSELLVKGGWPWNRWTQGQRIVVPDTGPLPTCTLPGGMLLTLLSPSAPKLAKLARKWKKDITRLTNDPKKPQFKGLVPGGGGFLGAKTAGAGGSSTSTDIEQLLKVPFTEDDAPHNGSSITVLAEYAGKSVLLGADAHPRLLAASLDRLMRERGLDPSRDRLQVDAFKVPHHGSRNNIDTKVLELLACRNYLISTDGSTFDHPDNEAIARVIAHGRHGDLRPRLCFNYESEENLVWKDATLQKQRAYDTVYAEGESGLVITL